MPQHVPTKCHGWPKGRSRHKAGIHQVFVPDSEIIWLRTIKFGRHSTVTSLTHWGRVTYICVNKLSIIGSDNALSPDRRQAIIWTNVGLLLIGPIGTNFIEILIEVLTFSFKKMRLNVSSAKRRPLCLGLNVFIDVQNTRHWYHFAWSFILAFLHFPWMMVTILRNV